MRVPKKVYTADEMMNKLETAADHNEIETWEAEELISVIDTVTQMAEGFKIDLVGFQFNQDFREISVKFKDRPQTSSIFLNSENRPQFVF